MIITLLASAMTVLFVLHAETDESSAQIIISGECGPNATYNIYSDDTLEITGSGEMYQYDATYAPWYENRKDITKITIGDNITKLGTSAFLGCNHITELTLPITLNCVVSDRSPAFAGCCSIEKVNFTSGHGGYGYNYAAYEGTNSWYQNTPWYQSRGSLKEINFADGVKGIGSDAFRELNITSIVLPDSVVHLGNHCFLNCTKLTDLTIPISLNSYGSDERYPAFRGCISIQKITFTNGNGVPFDYDDWAKRPLNTNLAPWNMYSDVAKAIIIPDCVSKLGECMFWDCNIKELTIPMSIHLQLDTYNQFMSPFKQDSGKSYPNLEKVTMTKGSGRSCNYSRDYANCLPWYEVTNLKTVIFEEGITRIGDDTLFYCNIENLVLPNTLTSFGESAIEECTIKNLTIPISLNAVWLDKHSAFDGISGLETITFTPGSGYGFNYAAYECMNCWYQHTPWYQCRSTLTSIVFEEGIKSIGSDAFRELNLTSIVIPNSVCSLSNHTFYQCSKLTDLTIPISLDSVASAKYPAFDRCDLHVVNFTSGVNGVGFDYSEGYYPPWAKVNGTSVTKMTFDGNITHVGKETFHGYTFYGELGEIDPCGYNLSGRKFEGADGQMWGIQDKVKS